MALHEQVFAVVYSTEVFVRLWMWPKTCRRAAWHNHAGSKTPRIHYQFPRMYHLSIRFCDLNRLQMNFLVVALKQRNELENVNAIGCARAASKWERKVMAAPSTSNAI